jgi:hypothetical protein
MMTSGLRRRALAGTVAGLVIIIAVAAVGTYFILSSSADPKPVHYIPYVVDQKLNQTTSYNYWNLAKDSIIVGLVGVGLSACTAETLGACAATSPAVATVIDGALQDTIVTITANFEFDNEGNGTATNLTFGVAVYSDGAHISTNYYNAGSLSSGSAMIVPYHYDIKMDDLPTAMWNYIQGKGQIDIELVNVTYGERT